MKRAERRERWERAFDPGRLALAGVILSMELFFQPSIVSRLCMLVVAALGAWLSGRRLSPLATVLTMSGIVFANLLVPIGRRIAMAGPLAITELALIGGIEKALTFEALMFISKASIGPGLRLPGRLGAFFAEAIRGYDRILEHKARIVPSRLIKSIDEILISVYDEDGSSLATTHGTRSSGPAARKALGRGDAALALVIAAFALPLLRG